MRTEKKIIAYNKEMESVNKLKKERNVLIPFKTKISLFLFIFGLNIITLTFCLTSIVSSGQGFLLFSIFASIFLTIPVYCHLEEKKRRNNIYFSPKLIGLSLISILGVSFLNISISYGLTILYQTTFHSSIKLDTISMVISGSLSLIFSIGCLIYIKKTTGDLNKNKKTVIKTKNEKIKELEDSIYIDLDSVDKVRLQSLEIKKMKLYYSNLLLIDVLKKRLEDSGYSNYEEYEEYLLSSKVRENNTETINLHNI